MTNFKGTHGKWLVKENNKISLFPIVEIAPMRFITVEGTNHIEPEYNALLISKAPEMLEMLGKAKSILGNVGEFELAKEIDQLIKSATTL